MILFRKVRQELLKAGKLKKFAFYAIGEIFLVVVGILIALQINNINEEKKEKNLANIYLKNLKLDLESDLEELESATNDLAFFEKEGYYSLKVLQGKIKEIDTVKFLKSLVWNNHFHMYQPARSTYEDLISSGNIKLIENNNLKVALSKYYIKDDWMGLFATRVKDTYWYLMREEMFKNIDPFMMGAFFDSEYTPESDQVIKYEDIKVDFKKIKNKKSLIDAIKRALSLRIWQRKEQRENLLEINNIMETINEVIK